MPNYELGDQMSEIGPELPSETVRRNLQFFWLADSSSSMDGVRIAKLNAAIKDALGGVQDSLSDRDDCAMFMRAIRFSTHAEWHVGPDPVSIEDFFWQDLDANGLTSTAEAIHLLCDQLEKDKITGKNFPPVCVLVSDGFYTSSDREYDDAINRLNSLFWGKKAIRLAIGIGEEGIDYAENQLIRFTNHPELGVLNARTPRDLVRYIRYATITVSNSVSTGANIGSLSMEDIPEDDIIGIYDDDDVELF